MNKRMMSLGLWTMVVGAGLATMVAWTEPPDKEDGDEGDDEVTIKLSEAPEPVRAAALKLTTEKSITKVIRESDDGITTFEIEFNEGGVSSSGAFTAAGDTLEIERGVAEAKVPAAALEAVKKAHPGATFGAVTSVTKMFYEIEIVKDGHKHEVKVDAAGEIEKGKHDQKDEEEDDERDEKHEKHGK